jgi:hypothetical protein
MIAMPFGRYQGWDITTVPRGYLRWVRDNVRLSPQLAHIVNCVIKNRTVNVTSDDLRSDEEKLTEIVKPWEE